MFRKVKQWWRKLPAWVEFGVLGAIAVGFIVVGGAILWATLAPIPSINNFENRKVAESTKIYDRTGNIVLYDVHGTMRRTAVPLDQISPYLRNATIAIEDATFYQHKGFRPLSFMRAIMVNISTGRFSQGGSTITQQVVKNALLTQRKTIMRKLEEIILALRLEQVYTKDQILNTYLNETSYGGTIYGVQEASQFFFGVDAKDIDLAQAAYLAALPQAPTRYSPHGNHRDELDARKNLVLRQMLENAFITNEEYGSARAEVVQFRDRAEAGIKAPHFVFFIREYLEEKYGADAVAQGGLHVITTLDYDLQKKAEEVISAGALRNEKNFNASNAGLVAVDPTSGQILAMVGSRGYFDEAIDGKVNITLAHRQPGSSFKPFVYATALEKGYTPETVVFDLQTQFSSRCAPNDLSDTPPCYSPVNFDAKFKGPLTFREALAQSINVAAVKVLYLAGIKNSIELARDMGITTLEDSDRYGLTLVLGGGEVTLLEMTGAYGVFANDGVKNPPTGVLEVKDRAGEVLEAFEAQSTRVMEPQIARQISDILSDNVARTPEFGADSPLNFSEADVADKTGTTNDYRDAWIIGYTPSISVGAWAGNNDNSSMQKRIAAFIIAPLWHEVMAYAIRKYPSGGFTPPAPEPALDSLPPVLRGNPNTDPAQGMHDILYWIDKDNPRGGGRDASDSQLPRWDYPVALWAQQNPSVYPSLPAPSAAPPGGVSSGFRVTSPDAGASIPYGLPITFNAVPSAGTVTSISYYVNGGLVGTAVQAPYVLLFTPNARGTAVLRAVALYANGTSEEQTITFTIQ
ncbi:MAG: PBP1A family penicillin-binding protein [Patescibacteria group bacterium]